eukprot:TRINITY_DN779_c0_g1_i2.p1 TRINITY_DN779_c0_g1~~TRINITY_DN779_c0_g1_i2.p1  ORF type:complete len:130 (-),score=30.81 TRINITY_DN779_c0_g1_i2:218-607(-)
MRALLILALIALLAVSSFAQVSEKRSLRDKGGKGRGKGKGDERGNGKGKGEGRQLCERVSRKCLTYVDEFPAGSEQQQKARAWCLSIASDPVCEDEEKDDHKCFKRCVNDCDDKPNGRSWTSCLQNCSC